MELYGIYMEYIWNIYGNMPKNHLSHHLPIISVYMSSMCFQSSGYTVSASFRNDAGLQTDFQGCKRTRLCNYLRAEVVY